METAPFVYLSILGKYHCKARDDVRSKRQLTIVLIR